MQFSIKEIAEAVGGSYNTGDINDDDTIVRAVSTDSRSCTNECLFIPIKGSNFDGHDYIKNAFENGAVLALSEREHGTNLIKVKSARKALQDLASYDRSKFKGHVVAITGSAGKTTTKEIIASVLSQKYKTLKTQGNLNNDLGLPLTLLGREEDDEVMVLEMGMNHKGEISVLSKIGKPDICLITNIGDAHIENLGSRRGILEAKCEIFEGMRNGGTVILNGDDPLLKTVKVPHANKIIQCNIKDAKNIQQNGLNGTSCEMYNVHINIPLPGNHMVMNALMAFSVGLELGLTPDEIKNGIESFKSTGHRMAISEIGEGSLKIKIINDTYNASPPSVKAAIDMLTAVEGRNVCILGDMYELGEFTEEMHKDVGQYAAERVDLLITIGEFSKNMNSKVHYDNKEDFINEWKTHIKPGDTVLIKASRGMALETIVEKIVGAVSGRTE